MEVYIVKEVMNDFLIGVFDSRSEAMVACIPFIERVNTLSGELQEEDFKNDLKQLAGGSDGIEDYIYIRKVKINEVVADLENYYND